MPGEFSSIIDRAAKVTVQNAMIATASAEKRVVPGNGADATIVPAQTPDQFVLHSVPDLELSRVGPYCKETAITAPLYTSHPVLLAKVTEFCNLAIRS